MRSVAGGLLAQTPDARGVDESTWQVVTQRQPTEAERRSLAFAWLAAKHVKSNAIVFIQGTATVGVGAGQMNRVDSVYLAAGGRATVLWARCWDPMRSSRSRTASRPPRPRA